MTRTTNLFPSRPKQPSPRSRPGKNTSKDWRKIIIYPLPTDITPNQLRDMLQSEIGPVESTSLTMSRGVVSAEVTFLHSDAHEAQKTLDGGAFDGISFTVLPAPHETSVESLQPSRMRRSRKPKLTPDQRCARRRRAERNRAAERRLEDETTADAAAYKKEGQGMIGEQNGGQGSSTVDGRVDRWLMDLQQEGTDEQEANRLGLTAEREWSWAEDVEETL